MDNTVKVAIVTGVFGIITLILGQSGLIADIFENQQPPFISDLIPTPPGPQVDRTPITWNAIASDPNEDTIYYKFELSGPSTGNRYVVQQNWSEKSEWIWNSTGSDIGINYIRVSHVKPRLKKKGSISSTSI